MSVRVHFPYQFDGRRRTREDDEAAWIRGLIEQVLFTTPGERVMRPEFGSGLHQLVFAPNSPELAATTHFLVQSALQQWLAGLISVEAVEVSAVDASLTVSVQYVILSTDTRVQDTFTRGGAT